MPEVCQKSYPTAVVFNLFIANPGIPRHELITSSESSHRLPMVAALGRNYLVYPLVDDDVIPHPDLQLCRPGKLAAKPGEKVPVGTMSGSSNPLFWQLWPLGASTRAISGCFRILPSFFFGEGLFWASSHVVINLKSLQSKPYVYSLYSEASCGLERN